MSMFLWNKACQFLSLFLSFPPSLPLLFLDVMEVISFSPGPLPCDIFSLLGSKANEAWQPCVNTGEAVSQTRPFLLS